MNYHPSLSAGWAVQHHGFARSTLDIDFVLCSDDKERLGKDLLDIRKQLQYNRTKISAEELLQLCKKYGPSEAYHTITHP